MGVLAELGLGAARMLEKRLGRRGALRVLVPMILRSEPSAARAAATVVALELAAELDDARALASLASARATEHAAARVEDLAPICARLVELRPTAARALADAEVTRRDDADARALRALVLERIGAVDDAIADWRAALLAAERDHATEAELAARVELARLLARHPGHRLEAAEVVAPLPDDAVLSPRARLVVAIARLGAPGRYARVRGLDALVDLASQEGHPEVARAAIRAACEHVDVGGGATVVELDRVRRAAERWPDPDVRGRLLAALGALAPALDADPAERSAALLRAAEAHEETRERLRAACALLEGEPVGPRPSGDVGRWCALAAVVALRGGDDEGARARLRELRGAGVGRGEAAAWTAAALAIERPALRDDALALAEALLATRSTPPRGFRDLALRLERAGADVLALRAWARAHELREPGAREERVAALVRSAWRAAARGRRDDAIVRLRDARALAGARGG